MQNELFMNYNMFNDYHIHYYLDGCASGEMALPQIDEACRELNIAQGGILKHYSHALPYGGDNFIYWHRIKQGEWARFLAEFAFYKPKYTRFFSGVETELLNQNGDINIPHEEQKKVDFVGLSVHFMPELNCLRFDLPCSPDLDFVPANEPEKRAENERHISRWVEKCADAGADRIIEGTAQAYINAIKKNPRIRSLTHMGDGMSVLRTYKINTESVSLKKRLEILEPLMKLAAEREIVWELTADGAAGGDEQILLHANRLGVGFAATADAHQLYNGWAPLSNHVKAEKVIERLMLNSKTILSGLTT